MGGDLPPAPDGTDAPSFLVAALMDPLPGNLDRIQIDLSFRTASDWGVRREALHLARDHDAVAAECGLLWRATARKWRKSFQLNIPGFNTVVERSNNLVAYPTPGRNVTDRSWLSIPDRRCLRRLPDGKVNITFGDDRSRSRRNGTPRRQPF